MLITDKRDKPYDSKCYKANIRLKLKQASMLSPCYPYGSHLVFETLKDDDVFVYRNLIFSKLNAVLA